MTDIYTHREQKDAAFTDEGRSPLSASQRARFSGLDYYRPSERYKRSAAITIFEQQRVVTLETSRGGQKHYYRYGWAKFELEEKRECLTLYLPMENPQQGSFFVPFLDSSNGEYTYNNGRYLDVARAEGELLLDFNLAYNPYCAYSARWDCVMPPIENTVEQPVRAGERAYPDREA